jgi:hypothetical protein
MTTENLVKEFGVVSIIFLAIHTLNSPHNENTKYLQGVETCL